MSAISNSARACLDHHLRWDALIIRSRFVSLVFSLHHFSSFDFVKSAEVLLLCKSSEKQTYQNKNSILETWMLHPTDYRELRNGKRYQTSNERIMSNHGSTEEIANRNSSQNVKGDVPEFRTLTQEAVNEQIRVFMAPLTRQLEELTWLVQGMTTSRHPISYCRTDLGTTSGTAMPQSDNGWYHGWLSMDGNVVKNIVLKITLSWMNFQELPLVVNLGWLSCLTAGLLTWVYLN